MVPSPAKAAKVARAEGVEEARACFTASGTVRVGTAGGAAGTEEAAGAGGAPPAAAGTAEGWMGAVPARDGGTSAVGFRNGFPPPRHHRMPVRSTAQDAKPDRSQRNGLGFGFIGTGQSGWHWKAGRLFGPDGIYRFLSIGPDAGSRGRRVTVIRAGGIGRRGLPDRCIPVSINMLGAGA